MLKILNLCYNTCIVTRNKMVTLKDIREGSIVILRPAFGTGAPVQVTVDTVYSSIKNGRPGVDYGNSWAYLTQVDRVVKY